MTVLRACPLVLLLACSSEPLGPVPTASGSDATPAATPTGTPTAVPTGTTPGPGANAAFAPALSYPAGPYGHGVGAVIENMTFLGWRDPVRSAYDPAAVETVSLAEFYDPTGTHTKLIVLNASAVWCGVCQSEMHDIQRNDTYQTYLDKGVQLVGTLFEDSNYDPAKPIDLKIWGAASTRTIAFPLLLDPGFKTSVYFTSDATPLNMVIDATNMRILHAMMGYDNSPDAGLWGLVDRELARRAVPAAP